MSNNTRIAKNTLYLYIRTFIVLVVSLYTSRKILEALGAEDLGLYNVIGGFVAIMSFFQAALSKASSRFITYELGKNNGCPSRTFSSCLTIHILLGAIVLFVGETGGIWFIKNMINIPLTRYMTALYVYHFSLLVFFLHIIRIPFDAVIIAHEKLSIFAYISILEAVLQLALAIVLLEVAGDSLLLYSSIQVCIALILFLVYSIYTRIKFPVYRFRFTWDKMQNKEILSFSAWTLLGTAANTGSQQGINILINNFIGVIANASIGLASQVNIAVGKFINSFSTAFTPQIIKLCAQKQNNELHTLINRSSKFSFALCLFLALPLIANMDFILQCWLGQNIPIYTKEICQFILACTIIDSTSSAFNTAITATGKIKHYQIAISVSFAIDFICGAVVIISTKNPALAFLCRIATRGFLNALIGLIFLKKQLFFDVKHYFFNTVFKICITLAISTPPIWIIAKHHSGLEKLIITSAASVFLISLCTFFIIMTQQERMKLLSKLCQKKHE